MRESNGKYRFYVVFRKFNALTKPDAYPMLNMDGILRKSQKVRYISRLNMSSAYHQIPLTEESKPVTAFSVSGKGLFQFRKMPFGLINAGATFQRLMDRVIGPKLEHYAFACLDDIIIVTETFDEHLKWLEKLLDCVKTTGIKINREKSVFCANEVKYLEVLANRDGCRPGPTKIEPIIILLPRN